MVKLIVFDWDDVITMGAKEGYIKCLHNTLVDLGIHLDPAEEHARIVSTWSKPHQEELKNLLRENPELLKKACKIYEDKFFGGTFVNSLRFVPGVKELLERLKEKYLLAIATGAHPKVLKDQVMPKGDIEQSWFQQIISAYEIPDEKNQKPAPYMLDHIMQTQRVLPNETIFVGDAKTDVIMANNAKVEPVVVLTGHLNREEAEKLEVKYIIPTVVDLEEVLSYL